MSPRTHEIAGSAGQDTAKYLPVCLAWALIVGAGMVGLQIYSAGPGAVGAAPLAWPVAGREAESEWANPRLTMVIHPHCPCSRASVTSLEHIAAIVHERVDIELVAYLPHNASQSWSESALLAAARRIPGLRVRPDPCGSLAFQLGAVTSGHVFLHDQDHRLRFSGGITPSRGHEGPSLGRTELLALLRGHLTEESSVISTPVFGCPLRDAEDPVQQCCSPLLTDGG